MERFLPYIVTVVCAIISGATSYVAARKQSKEDLKKLEKQHELNIEGEREKFQMEKEKMELEFQHEMELQRKDMENKVGADVVSVFLKEYMRSPEGKALMRNSSKPQK